MSRFVAFDHNRLLIDGRPRVLMCASLFPFRVPREQWKQRLQAVKSIGYHAIDVYIPWNFHETEPDIWNFEGQHDIEEFLRLTHEVGLYALVRPGPYICSEWDGGAIPAWVSTNGKTHVRQYDDAFLGEVRKWYGKIMPIIARQQYRGADADDGGVVILVQADNELDFYACHEPGKYIGALASMMRSYGVDVPIIACAGQGDMLRAGGTAEDVSPAVNLYPGDNDVDVDAQVRYYRRAADTYDVPLVVTETNRWHRTLRRLVGNGARFVGPFLQVSGWDFDYGTSVNNWGRVEAYMTHDYDFGGVIDPTGQERPDADDARRLCSIIDALGERLASATISDDRLTGIHLDSAEGDRFDETRVGVAVGSLDLHGGGRLLTFTNVSDDAADIRIGDAPDDALSDGGYPALTLPAGAGAMVVAGLPLGDGMMLRATSGELIELDESGHTLTLSAPTMAPGRFGAIIRPAHGIKADDIHIHTDALTAHMVNGDIVVQGDHGTATIGQGQSSWRITFTQPEHHVVLGCAPHSSVRSVAISLAWPSWTLCDGDVLHDALPLEDMGVYSGAGRYRAATNMRGALGVVLHNAADTVNVRCGNSGTDWQACGGVDAWIPFNEPVADDTKDIVVTTRIWGHSNFDDTRLNALRLNGKRGMCGAMSIERVLDIGSGWRVGYNRTDPDNAERLRENGLVLGDAPVPRCGFGSRSTTAWPHALVYTRTLSLGGASACLHIEHGQTRCEVRVGGRTIGIITPLAPTLWLGEVPDGSELSIVVNRMWGEDAGRIALLVGDELTGWTCESQGLKELRASCARATYVRASLPVLVPGGEGRWIRVPGASIRGSEYSNNTIVRFDGEGLQLTAFTDEYCLGRVVLGPLPGTVFAGGRGDLFVVPHGEGDLMLYAESTRERGGTLRGIMLGGSVDR